MSESGHNRKCTDRAEVFSFGRKRTCPDRGEGGCDGASGWSCLQPGSRLRCGGRFRGPLRDRRLDQPADAARVRSAVQVADGGACREQAGHRTVAADEDRAIAVDRDAAHGVGDAAQSGIAKNGAVRRRAVILRSMLS